MCGSSHHCSSDFRVHDGRHSLTLTVAKLLQFNVILSLIHLGYIYYLVLTKITKGTVKGQGSLTYYPYPYPQVPLPITLKGYPYPCYCLYIPPTITPNYTPEEFHAWNLWWTSNGQVLHLIISQLSPAACTQLPGAGNSQPQCCTTHSVYRVLV